VCQSADIPPFFEYSAVMFGELLQRDLARCIPTTERKGLWIPGAFISLAICTSMRAKERYSKSISHSSSGNRALSNKPGILISFSSPAKRMVKRCQNQGRGTNPGSGVGGVLVHLVATLSIKRGRPVSLCILYHRPMT
jgi:hypothetical protein